MQPEKIGLLGGSFNPIHNGHLSMAHYALTTLALTRVLFIPTGNPPHKHAGLADKTDRLQMATCALQENPAFEICDLEITRPGVIYTVDTLRMLHKQWPQAHLIYLVGADTLLDLPNWRDFETVAKLCSFAIVPRCDIMEMQGQAEMEALQERFDTQAIYLSGMPQVDISATAIRERVMEGKTLDGLVPPCVADYIDAQRLYHPPTQCTIVQMHEKLEQMLSPERYHHSVGTMQTMEVLAKRFDVSQDRACIAGLLHDCAKGIPLIEMQLLAQKLGVKTDVQRMQSTALLHAPVGAAMLRSVFGVTDPAILRAVRWHNTGTIDMSKLDKMLYLADKIEPGRKMFEGLEQIRTLAMENLNAAVLKMIQSSSAHIQSTGAWIHPDTLAAMADMERVQAQTMQKEA